MSDMVMKAVTTPPQCPVLTAGVVESERDVHCTQLKVLTTSGNLAVVNVTRGTKASATVGLSQEHAEFSAGRVRVHDVALVQNPVPRGRVSAVVSCICVNAGKIGEGVLLQGRYETALGS